VGRAGDEGLTPGDPAAAVHAALVAVPDAAAVVLAVSGGPDSAGLARLVTAARPDLRATVVHVRHGLRDDAVDADTAVAVARALGLPAAVIQVAVGAGAGPEDAARQARLEALCAAAVDAGADYVLTGHTADDQAETVLLNLLRGAGLDGLTGFDPANRPIRGLRRRETHKLCADLGIQPVHDPTNDDGRFRRNRVRLELLPLLDAIAERDVAAVLARQADLLRADAELLDELAGHLDPTDAKALAAAPVPVAARAVRRWLRAGPEQHPPDAATVARVLAVARGDATACDVGGGRAVRRGGQRLRLYRAERGGRPPAPVREP